MNASNDKTFSETLLLAQQTGEFQPVVDKIPYAGLIGLQFQRLGNDVLFHLPKNDNNIGNPILPAIHGGVIGGFMELSASLHLMMNMDCATTPKMIDFSLDYLRAGRHQDTFAECQVWRQGNRVANVAINAWQTTRENPIATARAHFLLSRS
ncbi:PaaI family thioesterase [Bacterioplanoides sp. SCSIO 12839]|uniref:PaaI family thioesterase n=1 Tax=Bacterioplanoides sp. SCSIO 12839 TaxID=2829569 RepID=UPI002105FF09|nr:PaaI family thioesterase [Bacterioplanoides sp. SCSIO 12839]UTW49420.1 PaaI family thioesterase [Bacterioplanoides sp. SCSIO 12839]